MEQVKLKDPPEELQEEKPAPRFILCRFLDHRYSAHGFPRGSPSVPNGSVVRRAFWLLLTLGLILFSIWQIWTAVIKFYEVPRTTNIKLDKLLKKSMELFIEIPGYRHHLSGVREVVAEKVSKMDNLFRAKRKKTRLGLCCGEEGSLHVQGKSPGSEVAMDGQREVAMSHGKSPCSLEVPMYGSRHDRNGFDTRECAIAGESLRDTEPVNK
ncbi:unnamed protein product [Cyprideis torosa]|uniref:Uncharacterized protein n=1 Tax=Cyprideis torosa TaxID=163714 RepID=A0A7R8W3X4_9CRUS|nr:unnamed protein product [Cyprideis torosa]CAG0883384.1 unnamed protein product [Cyprideis torosa]